MSSVNITRAEAQQRSQVITAHNSKVLVDLSGRDPNGDPLAEPTETFVSSSTIEFSSTGGESHLDLIADGVTPQISTAPRWIRPHSRIIVSRLPRKRELTKSRLRRCAATPIRVKACIVSSTLLTARFTSTPSSRLLMPGVCTLISSSPIKR